MKIVYILLFFSKIYYESNSRNLPLVLDANSEEIYGNKYPNFDPNQINEYPSNTPYFGDGDPNNFDNKNNKRGGFNP